jgi:hypothetical protein
MTRVVVGRSRVDLRHVSGESPGVRLGVSPAELFPNARIPREQIGASARTTFECTRGRRASIVDAARAQDNGAGERATTACARPTGCGRHGAARGTSAAQNRALSLESPGGHDSHVLAGERPG